MSDSKNKSASDDLEMESTIPENTESSEANEESTPAEKDQPKKGNPVKRFTFILLGIIIVFFFLYVFSDRHTPYTDQARISGLVVPITPRVSGNLTKIHVHLHQQVEEGDTLFQLDPRPFILEIQSLEAQLDNTFQQVDAKTAQIKSATGRLGIARARLDRATRNYNRIEQVYNENPGALSLMDRDRAETDLASARENEASALADLERAEKELGLTGTENPQYKTALKALEEAQLNLAFTSIIATTPGVIESLSLDLGYYSGAGQPIATMISNTDVWIQADMKENNISRLEVGHPIEFTLDVEPGKVYRGKVRSIGYGVSSGGQNRGDLPSISGQSGWLRDPQRFPVIITIDEGQIDKALRLGGQVDVVAYTGDSFLLNLFARWRIRINSWISFVR